ncbi:MAG: aminoglycoside phosphotransferase family protein [Bacteroidales bacterium]|nr:aminoglycoside phosphotransferase family protein [Bacteroidales bacterium]
MEKDLEIIARRFNISGEIIDITAVTTGHINDSYLIRTRGDSSGYFLQWINSYIFKDVKGLMKNIEMVTLHLGSKSHTSHRDGYRVLELVPALDGKTFIQDEKGEFWRMYYHIPGTHVYDVVENEAIAYEGGKAFGRFISDLADLPASELTDTIPDFHNMEKRLLAFRTSIDSDPVNRKSEISEEIRFIEERAEEMLKIPALIKNGSIPMRITHNDTKFNNILFDSSNKAICIVDLDTVMPGSVLFDFGDAIRTGANTCCEDEKDLSLVNINLPIYEAYARGFIQMTQRSLVAGEIANLAFAARFMTFIIGLRFLTDFIDGDPYFRTNYPTHNLDRTRVQFKLIEAMENNSEAMEEIIIKACQNCKGNN